MSERASRSRIPGLDGLRGLAAMLVLVAHLSQWGYSLIPGLDLSGIGASGVMLFFVLSSFLLTSQILGWSPDAIVKLKPWLLYFEARCLRIWPLYLVVLLVSLTSTYLHYIPIGWKAAPFLEHVPVPMTVDSLREHLLLQTGEDILWTIPIEFKFYLLLPFLLIAIVLPLHNHQGATISVVGAGILAADWQISTEGGGADPVPFIGVFLTGMLLAFVWCNGRRTRIFGKRQRIFYECLAWLCSAIYVCLIPSVYLGLTGEKIPFNEAHAHALYAILWAALIILMLSGLGRMRRILDSRPFIFVGTISYSFYLWHRVPMYLMHRLTYFHYVDFLPQVLKGWIILAVALLLARLSYLLVERPVQQWRANLRAPKQGV